MKSFKEFLAEEVQTGITDEWFDHEDTFVAFKPPKPINYEEFQTVIAAEDARAKSIAPGFIWNLRGFDSKFNIIFLEIPNGVQVSMRAKLNYTGRTDFIPIQNFPPKATEIAIRKIWNEFEKIEFIQRATLKKK